MDLPREEEEDVALPPVGVVTELELERPVTLPIRNRGTRVCILCSKFFTRARISDTICTPLLLDVVLVVDVVLADAGLRVAGRVTGVRGEV